MSVHAPIPESRLRAFEKPSSFRPRSAEGATAARRSARSSLRSSVIAFLAVVFAGLPAPAGADSTCDDACIDGFQFCEYDCAYSGPSCGQACDQELEQCLADCNADDAGGRWLCTRDPWTAATTERRMLGLTRLECGWFQCGDTSHSRPTSYVDIVGGISQTCEDRSASFNGPDAGEWNMCSASYGGDVNQVDMGRHSIEGVNDYWDRWPYKWRYRNAEFPRADICNEVGGSGPMVQPFATIYDLDYCWNKQVAGTIYWPNFDVDAKLVAGDCNAADGLSSTVATFAIRGATPLACSTRQSTCENQVCADLEVASRVHCTWYPQ